jgi:hypothetical protein
LVETLDTSPQLAEYVLHFGVNIIQTSIALGNTHEDIINRFAGQFPHLESLTIQGCYLPYDSHLLVEQTFFLSVTKAFTHITSISLHVCEFPSLLEFQPFVLGFTFLRHLHMRQVQFDRFMFGTCHWDDHARASTRLNSITVSEPRGFPESMAHMFNMLISTGLATDIKILRLNRMASYAWTAASVVPCRTLFCHEVLVYHGIPKRD